MNIDFSKMIVIDREKERTNQIKSEIASRRYAEETRGINVSGFYLNTERDSQSLLTGAALAAYMDSNYTCRWKTSEGFVELDASSLINISHVMRQHVQSCFDREGDLLAALEDGTYADAMLDEGWPV